MDEIYTPILWSSWYMHKQMFAEGEEKVKALFAEKKHERDNFHFSFGSRNKFMLSSHSDGYGGDGLVVLLSYSKSEAGRGQTHSHSCYVNIKLAVRRKKKGKDAMPTNEETFTTIFEGREAVSIETMFSAAAGEKSANDTRILLKFVGMNKNLDDWDEIIQNPFPSSLFDVNLSRKDAERLCIMLLSPDQSTFHTGKELARVHPGLSALFYVNDIMTEEMNYSWGSRDDWSRVNKYFAKPADGVVDASKAFGSIYAECIEAMFACKKLRRLYNPKTK
jgi:hypothetical protein